LYLVKIRQKSPVPVLHIYKCVYTLCIYKVSLCLVWEWVCVTDREREGEIDGHVSYGHFFSTYSTFYTK